MKKNYNSFLKKITIIIFSILSQFLFAQIDEKRQQEIQNLWDNSDKYILRDAVSSMRYAKQASLLSEKYGDSFNKAKSYLICLLSINMYKESLFYLDKGLKEPATADHHVLKVLFKEFKGDNYGKMGLPEQEFNEYSDILSFVPKDEKNHEYQRTISRIQARIAANLIKMKDYDNADRYINKSMKIREKFAEGELYNIYMVKGDVCLNRKVYDSAFYFFNKSYNMVKKGIEYEYPNLKSFGDYYKAIGNIPKTISFYEKAIANIKDSKIDDVPNKAEIYKNLYQLSGKIGNEQKRDQYSELYHIEYEKLQDNNNQDIQFAVKSILNQEQQEKKLLKKHNSTTVFSILGVFSIFSAIFYFQFIKMRRKKKELKIRFEEIVKELEERKKRQEDNNLEIAVHQLSEKDADPETSFKTNTKLISDETEKVLLSKLISFEKGTAFTEKGFTQSNLATILETNTKYLNYILKIHRNKSFNDYVNGLKINFIVDKIYNHPEYLNYKISYLSEISGFSSQSRFTHIFKQEQGMSPSEFITQLSQKQNKNISK
ncbi:helix-turn-helix domain-containing protein [Chryseobacterium echinoideorum]|uniref:helix-turn-helix domain-containing protein n=1 Tax=Chryseobacterium echinoideorum TaxID=1549648 RepID=UPI00118556C9|nr:AraC family transcriptional regulator [Chryseobacterium echinoideorum]